MASVVKHASAPPVQALSSFNCSLSPPCCLTRRQLRGYFGDMSTISPDEERYLAPSHTVDVMNFARVHVQNIRCLRDIRVEIRQG
jgi:hypothetical protein